MSKVLLEFNSVDFGSTGNVAKSIVEAAKKHGIKSFMFCGQHKRDDKTSYSIADSSSPLYLSFESRVLQPLLGYGFNCSNATKKMLLYFKTNFVSSGDSVVIHIHNVHGAFVNLPEIIRFVKDNNYKLAITLHDCWYFTGGCAYFDLSGCNSWEGQLCKKCHGEKIYPLYPSCASKTFKKKRELFKTLRQDQVLIVTPSDWLSELARKSFLGNFKIETNHHGIDVSKWQKTGFSPRKASETINVVSLASPWTKRKGLDDINFCADHAPSNFHFTVIGLRNSDITSPNIERKGHISDEEVTETMANADILLNPTYEDNFPATNIEGLSLGLFVITYKTGGSPESIDENTGVAVNRGDKNELLKAVTSFVPNEAQRRASISRSKMFSLEKQNEKYLDLISDLFGQ